MKRVASGFSLIEIMVAVAIVGVLSAVALPSYQAHVKKSRLTDAFSGLAAVQPVAENYWLNNRTYVDFDKVPVGTVSRMPPDTANFTFKLTTSSASEMVVTATGIAQVAGFTYTINQRGVRGSTTPYGNSDICWVDAKGGKCTQ